MTESGGDWPDEYHFAADRLYAMFDAIDELFAAGQLDDHVNWSAVDHDDGEELTVVVKPVVDSLASARISAVCEIGFQFNATTLLCGKHNCSVRTLYELYQARREPQRGPRKHYRGVLSHPHSVCFEIGQEGGNVGRGVPSPSDKGSDGAYILLSSHSGVRAEPRPKMDFLHILGQKEAI